MDQNNPTGSISRGQMPSAGEIDTDYRTRIAAHQADAAERRKLELSEQRSSTNTPAMRIRIWERLHHIDLPRSPSHRLIDVIAAQTGLTSEDVRDEQRLRTRPTVPTVPAAPAAPHAT